MSLRLLERLGVNGQTGQVRVVGADGPERESHLAGLRTWMDTQKPYLDPVLTIEDLAGQLDVPVKVLSQVINESLGQNFFDFVNSYRVEEAKKLLANARDPKITVFEVMYQAGFNSKSSFNTAFKKNALTTPGAYKKKVLGIRAEG